MRHSRRVVLAVACVMLGWSGLPALGAPITTATVGGSLSATFYPPPYSQYHSASKQRTGSVSLDVSVSNPPPDNRWGQFVGVINMTGGKCPTIDLAASATGELMYRARTDAQILYAFRVVQRDPEAPLMPVWVSLEARFEASVTNQSGYAVPSAGGNVMFRKSSAYDWELLAGGYTSDAQRTVSEQYDDSKIVPVGSTAYLQIWMRGEINDDYSPRRRGEWQIVADPIVRIDPTYTVLVGGVQVPATELYDIEMSDGFLPAYGEPFRWVNPAGGAFPEAANWETYGGPAVPHDASDLEFMSLPGGRSYSVVLDQDRTIAGISVCDADVTLELEGHRLENTGPIFIGQTGPDRGLLRIHNGTLAAADGVKLGMTPDVEGVLQIDGGATLDTTRVWLNSSADHMLGSGTLVLAGGTLRAEEIVVQGQRATLAFDSGAMILDGGYSSFYTGSPIVVGNGTDAANLTILSGYASFSDGLALAAGAALELRGGSLYTPSFSTAPGSAVAWSGGEWTCGSPLSLGEGDPLGADLSLNADMSLYANGGFHVNSSGRLSVNGGMFSADTFTHDEGAVLEYASGKVQLNNGDIAIGPGGFTGPGGSQVVTLADANDRLAAWSGGMAVDEGYTLRLAAGTVQVAGLLVEGTFDYGGPAPDEPGQGALGLNFSTPEPGCLRIGADSGDAVINGRTVVKVGTQGRISVNGGSLRVDAGYELHLFGLGDPEEYSVYADRIELAGTILLDQTRLQTGALVIEPTGCLAGNGIVGYSVENGGLVSPGNSPGLLEIWGDFSQTPTGKLVLEIAGLTQFDALLVHGTCYLGGTLEIVLRDGYVPGQSDSFTLLEAGWMEGNFEEVLVSGGPLHLEFSPAGLVVHGVPEPSTVFLLLSASAVVLLRSRRRGKKKSGS